MDPTTDGRLEDEFLFSKGAIVRWHLSFGGVVSMVQKSEPLRVAIGDPMIWFGFINTRRSLLLDFWTIKNLAPRGWETFPVMKRSYFSWGDTSWIYVMALFYFGCAGFPHLFTL